MEIESDHLVYEYLSRVGDLAQRRHLSSGDRMRLVAGLRDEIDRRRAKYEPETPAAVRRILERIGTPEEVLDTLSASGADGSAAVSSAPSASAASAAPSAPSAPSVPVQRGAAPPHLAGLDELGAGEKLEPDWWTVGPASAVEGFAGGIEIPELLKGPRPGPRPEREPDSQPGDPAGAPAGGQPTLMGFLRERRRRAKAEAAAAAAAPVAAAVAAPRRKPYAFLVLAAVALLAGAVSGYWLLLAAGWLLAYASRVLGAAERKWVVFGLPGVVFAGAVVWLWGRLDGRWGDALADEALSGTFQGLLPWLARAAAVSSALYLLWRSRRR